MTWHEPHTAKGIRRAKQQVKVYSTSLSSLLTAKGNPVSSIQLIKPRFFECIGWLWGDPHFVTLDGKNYTFNGLGEYTMVNVKNGYFELQARTKLAKGEGTATVFAAAVAREANTSTVQISLNNKG